MCHCLSRLPGDIPAAEKEAMSVGEGNFVPCGNEKNVLFCTVTNVVACMINDAISRCNKFHANGFYDLWFKHYLEWLKLQRNDYIIDLFECTCILFDTVTSQTAYWILPVNFEKFH